MLSRRDILIGTAALGAANLLRPVTTMSAKAAQPATRVGFEVPKNSCDCHVHIFGDPQRVPFAASRTYTPESASVDELQALHRTLHVDRVVIIQPSVYGTDNSCTLDALKQLGTSARGIAVIDQQTSSKALDEMDRAGVRGVRINLGTTGQNDPAIARRRLQAALEQAPEVLDSVGVHVLFYVTLKMVDDFVSEAIFQIGVAGELIGVNFGSRLNHFADDSFWNVLSAMRNDCGLYLSAALQQSHDNSLTASALYSALAAHALPFCAVHESRLAADESLIDFDRSSATAQFGEAASLQSEAQPMQNEPCGLLSDSQSACDFVGTDTVAAVDQHPQSGKPLVEGDGGILENGAEFYGELLVALFALPALLGFQVVVLFVAAGRTFRAFGPTKRGYGVNADLLVGKVPDSGLKCLWLSGFHASKVAHSPWLVK